jgi:DNA-binding transcriptional regulator YiaG
MKQLYFTLKEDSEESLLRDAFFDFLNVNGSSMFVAFENFDSIRFKNTTMIRYAIMSGLLRLESYRYLNLIERVLNDGSSFSHFSKLKKFLKNEEISQFHLLIGYKECLKLVWENIEFDYQKKLDEFNTRIHLESKFDELVSKVKENQNSSIQNAKLILKELENKKINEKFIQNLRESFNLKIHVFLKFFNFSGATCLGEVD